MSKPNFYIYHHTISYQNYKFWQEHVDELDAWLKANKGQRSGQPIWGLNPKKQSIFALKWS